jgi:hypothetical protein
VSVERAVLFRLATSHGFERAARGLPQGERLAWQAASRAIRLGINQGRTEALNNMG